MTSMIRRIAAAALLAALASCSNTSPPGRGGFTAPADYVQLECTPEGTLLRNTHRSCQVKVNLGWSEPDGRKPERMLTLPPGSSQLVVPRACARLLGADFLTPICV